MPHSPPHSNVNLAGLFVVLLLNSVRAAPSPPNVIVILSDDQGYGDYGFTGNPLLKTPHLDKLAETGIWLDHFYTETVCAPTRAGLLTGRYAYRCNVPWVGPYLHPDELTLAEAFQTAGYATGIFGKWGFGTNYPYRPQEQGFDEVLVHLKGQFSPPMNKTAYFDPVLWHNGRERQFQGYCNDIWFDAAEAFIRRNKHKPFLVYIPTNLPHLPAQVPVAYSAPYLEEATHDQIARAYGMIAHIDERVGRLVRTLKESHLYDDTILVYLGDNGSAWVDPLIYTGGLRGKKADMYEGGIRQPCLINWPRRWRQGRKIDAVTSHVDLFPTLLAAAGIDLPHPPKLDGKNLLPLLDGRGDEELLDRTLISQGYPTGTPMARRCFMVRGPRYKLVQPVGLKREDGVDWINWPEERFRYELYDLKKDRGEREDLAQAHPEIVAGMLKQYDAWFDDVSRHPGSSRARPVDQIGHAEQPTVRVLCYGGHAIDVRNTGPYRITLEPFGIRRTLPGDIYADIPFHATGDGRCSFTLGEVTLRGTVERGDDVHVFEPVHLPEGQAHFRVAFDVAGKTVFGGKNDSGQEQGPIHVTFALIMQEE